MNLFLAVTGPREDGFHDLVSLVVPVAFGDDLRVEWDPSAAGDTLFCESPGVPVDGSNLVLRAAEVFRQEYGFSGGMRFFLQKRIPMGSGFGGGSSNGAAALKAVNVLLGEPLGKAALAKMAAILGSDCPLFLENGPVMLRGRGEQVTRLGEEAIGRLRSRRLLLFKPNFSINTGWAYGQMKVNPRIYVDKKVAEARLAKLLQGAIDGKMLFNNFEQVAFREYEVLGKLMEKITRTHNAVCHMSGSGSGCFVLIEDDAARGAIGESIRALLGEDIFIVETFVS